MEWENLESQYLVDNEFLKVRQDKVTASYINEKKLLYLICAQDIRK